MRAFSQVIAQVNVHAQVITHAHVHVNVNAHALVNVNAHAHVQSSLARPHWCIGALAHCTSKSVACTPIR